MKIKLCQPLWYLGCLLDIDTSQLQLVYLFSKVQILFGFFRRCSLCAKNQHPWCEARQLVHLQSTCLSVKHQFTQTPPELGLVYKRKRRNLANLADVSNKNIQE
jgi:hypothetical protein